jgi:general secretion pathway protein D
MTTGMKRVMVIVVALTALVPPAFAAERTFPLHFKHSFVDKLIKRVAEETGRTIIFDERVRGNISVITKREVTESEAWGILEASLSILGFSLLPSPVGNWRIAKVAEAVGEAPFVDRAGPESDSFVTALISLERADLQGVIDVLEPLSGARVTLVAYEPTNSVFASGPERANARFTSIADELDRVEELTLRYRVLRYRDVIEIEDLVESRIESMGESARLLQVWSDERTNSVLFRGTDENVARLARFLNRIDQPSSGTGRIQVLRVLNRDPVEMATLLEELSRSPSSSNDVSSIRTRDSELVGADFSIATDRASRSLVVRAAPDIQRAIRDLLEELDVPPQLIAVDVTITEVRTPRSKALGFAFNIPLTASTDASDLVGRLISSPVPGAALAQTGGPGTTLFGRVARDTGVTIEGPDDENGIPTVIPIDDTGVIQAGAFSIETEVLIHPHLIVVAGERHELFVGSNVPVPVTESGVGEADPDSILGVSLSRTIRFERTDIGITLGLDATAGRKGKIQLDLDIELSTFIPSESGPIEEVGPSFLNETLTATARLDHGETAIIGVNRQGKELVGRSGVPWLSDIPFLGWFFTADSESQQDVRLVFAVRARRVSSPAALVADTIRRRLIFQRQNARGGNLVSPDGLPYGVRVTTREREDDAEAIAEGLSLTGYQTTVHSWSDGETEFFDVYVVSLESMMDAAEVATTLTREGWDPDLVILKTRS